MAEKLTGARQARAIELLEQCSARLWISGANHSLAREIDRYLDEVSPESNTKIVSLLSAGRSVLTQTQDTHED